MIAKPLFRKNYFLFVGIFLLVFALFLVFDFMSRSINRSINRERMVPPHHEMVEGLLDASGDPLKTLKEFRETNGDREFMQMDIVRADGKSALDGTDVLTEPLTGEELAKLSAGETIFQNREQGPPALVSALKAPDLFVTTRPRHRGAPGGAPPGPGGPGFGPPPGPPIFVILSFFACICISVGIALLVFFSNYRKRAEESLVVLNALKSGDLTARMPTGKLDELAPLTSAFNHMADEIQRLFETLRKSDEARRRLLQDLAHDLRTPLASLRTFVETLQESGDRLTAEKRGEILQLCRGEIDYFSNLVEDLLFLAQITEPKYTLEHHAVDLHAEVEAQVQVFRNRSPQIGFTVDDRTSRTPVVQGSPKLIARLLRNALSNSAHHARAAVRVILVEDSAGLIRVTVEDDGPGFSPKALEEFGIKKGSRVLSDEGGAKKISVGIGSVIMREITQLHGGTLRAENRVDGAGRAAGARIEISFVA